MSEKMWAGRFEKPSDRAADDFNSSIRVDGRMYREDIEGSVAHAAMLGTEGIIPSSAAEHIIEGLGGILADLDAGKLSIDGTAEDIHMFIEGELTRRIGNDGKMLHTGRSRNDQVAVDIRLYLRGKCAGIISLLRRTVGAILDKAAQNKDVILPGYTHLQRAQPITFSHHLFAYGFMFSRDIDRLMDAMTRMNVCPLGSAALAGTTYPIDRERTAAALGFDAPMLNSLDGVSDRDFCVEILSALSTVMMHLSRFCEEIILWSSWEFSFVELDDAYTTGSSIMPQKKNSDMAELIRGKTGRVYGDLLATLTMLKGLPLAYNKDMQEDKEQIFDAVDTVEACLGIFIPMLSTMKTHPDKMRAAASGGFINATDLADYLAKKGMPFRAAYKIVGEMVGECIRTGKTLETLPLAAFKAHSDLFEDDVYDAIDLANCVKRRTSLGGTGFASYDIQTEYLKKYL